MKYCVFSDVHGNLHNLELFFDLTSKMKIDKFICLGDLCNYYPDNLQVIDLLIKKNVLCLLGNHDEFYTESRLLTDAKKSAYNYDEKLEQSNRHINFLSNLPKSLVLNFRLGDAFFCHGSPYDLTNGYIYPDSDLNIYSDSNYKMIFCGHTHRQFIKKVGKTIICNVGSVGMPRDNGLLLGFITYDDSNDEVTLYRSKLNKTLIENIYSNRVHIDVIRLLDRNETINNQFILV